MWHWTWTKHLRQLLWAEESKNKPSSSEIGDINVIEWSAEAKWFRCSRLVVGSFIPNWKPTLDPSIWRIVRLQTESNKKHPHLAIKQSFPYISCLIKAFSNAHFHTVNEQQQVRLVLPLVSSKPLPLSSGSKKKHPISAPPQSAKATWHFTCETGSCSQSVSTDFGAWFFA